MRQTLDSAELNTCILGNEGKGKASPAPRAYKLMCSAHAPSTYQVPCGYLVPCYSQ